MKGAPIGLMAALGLAHLGRRRRQTVVSVLGVMLGVGAFIAIAAMMQGFHRDFVARVIDASPHVVMKDEYRTIPEQPAQRAFPDAVVEIKGLRPKQELRGIRNPNARLGALQRTAGLKVAPALRGQVILRFASTDVAATMVGIEPELEREVSSLEDDLISGTLRALRTTANGVILGVGLARKLGVARGDSLTAVSASGVVLRMKAAGLFRTGITSIDNFEAYALLKKVQVLERRPNVINRINMRLDDVTRARAVAAAIEREHGYRTESWEEANEDILGLFVIQNAIMYSVVGAVLVVAGFGIFNIVSTVIHEKVRDIAILKSIGFSPADVRAIFVLQGFVLGLGGAVLGWALGYALTELLASIRFEMDLIIATRGFVLYRWVGHYLIAGGVAIATATVAAWMPARHAAELDPVSVLRGGP